MVPLARPLAWRLPMGSGSDVAWDDSAVCRVASRQAGGRGINRSLGVYRWWRLRASPLAGRPLDLRWGRRPCCLRGCAGSWSCFPD